MTTKDQRICRSDCTTKPTPGNAGAPQAPVEAVAKSIEANDKIGIDSSKTATDKSTSYSVGSDFLQCIMDMNQMSARKDEFPDFVEHKS